MRSWPSPVVPQIDVAGARPVPTPRVRDTASGTTTSIGEGRDTVSVYVCGITPYDATHLGHAATYLLFDTLGRVVTDSGRALRYVQNVTDVDDPLLERAAATGVDWTELAERETELFRTDMAALRIVAPEAYVGAVEAVPTIAAAVGDLVERGAAYDVDGDVYFSVAAAAHFGEVSSLDRATMTTLSRERGGDPDRPGKKDPLDCLLWQAARPGEPSWPSPQGQGRPGWHVECAAIALDRLGPVIDVQGGGDDLVFPHHEMGASEASVVTGQWPFARSYVHQAMVGYDGEKMSKSRGNLVLVSRLREQGADPSAIRLALLDHPHWVGWEWQDGELSRATERLGRWREGMARPSAPPAAALVDDLRAALYDGLHTPDALAAVDAWAATPGEDTEAPAQVAVAVDALLGIV